MKKSPTIASGVAIAAGGMLAAALVTPTLSATADGDGGSAADEHERSSGARAFPRYTCDGGATRRVWNHGMDSNFESIASGTDERVTRKIRFRGPRKGRDTLSVTVSGVTHGHSSAGAASLVVTVNGRAMRPTEFNTTVPFSAGPTVDGNSESHTLQFCRKINRGRKRLNVTFHASGGDVHLQDAVVHAELNK